MILYLPTLEEYFGEVKPTDHKKYDLAFFLTSEHLSS